MITKMMFPTANAAQAISKQCATKQGIVDYLSTRTAYKQFAFCTSALSLQFGEGEFLMGGIYDVIGDLEYDCQKYGANAKSLTPTQIDTIAREISIMFRRKP